MGLPDQQSPLGFRWRPLDIREWHRHSLPRNAICKQAPRAAFPSTRGRGRIWLDDRRNGDCCTFPLGSLDSRPNIPILEGGQSVARDTLLPDCVRNSLVCLFAAIPIYIRRSGALSELRRQCIPVASPGSPLPFTRPFGDDTVNGTFSQ